MLLKNSLVNVGPTSQINRTTELSMKFEPKHKKGKYLSMSPILKTEFERREKGELIFDNNFLYYSDIFGKSEPNLSSEK